MEATSTDKPQRSLHAEYKGQNKTKTIVEATCHQCQHQVDNDRQVF